MSRSSAAAAASSVAGSGWATIGSRFKARESRPIARAVQPGRARPGRSRVTGRRGPAQTSSGASWPRRIDTQPSHVSGMASRRARCRRAIRTRHSKARRSSSRGRPARRLRSLRRLRRARRARHCAPGAVAAPRPARCDARAARTARFDDWIFTSPAAVRFGAALLPPRRAACAASRVCASATAPRARWRGTASRRRSRATVPTAKACSRCPALERVRGRRIALVGAPGGRDLIAPTLRRRGAKVDAIHVYRRVAPRLTRRHFDALAAARDPLIMLVSSGEALANLVALLPPPVLARLRGADRRRQQRPARRARRGARVRGHRARRARPRRGDLLDAAAAALARHRL